MKASVIRDLLPGKRLVVEVSDYRGTRHQAIFSLLGFTAAFDALERYCATTLEAAVAQEVDRQNDIDEEFAFIAEQQRVVFSGSERERLEFRVRAAKRSLLQSVPEPERLRISKLLDAGRIDDAEALLPNSSITVSNIAVLKRTLRDLEDISDSIHWEHTASWSLARAYSRSRRQSSTSDRSCQEADIHTPPRKV